MTFPRGVRAAHPGTIRLSIPADIAGLAIVPVGAQTSALATEAATEIARFDAEFGASSMAFAPLLQRSEPASSSQIEHLTSSARAIALAELGRTGRNNADLIVSNVRAMQAAFMARPDLPVLTQAVIAHAQFETIHAFPDGNGRVGRALVHSLLKAGGLARSVTVPVSAGLLGDTGTYFAALTAYRAGDPEPIVTVMAEATFPSTRRRW